MMHGQENIKLLIYIFLLKNLTALWLTPPSPNLRTLTEITLLD